MRKLALFLLLAAAAFGQSLQPTDNPNQIIVTPSWLYLNKMHYAGSWSQTTTYNNQDVVVYNGSTYVSNGLWNLGQTPSSSPVWWTALGGSGGGGGMTNPMSAQYDLIIGGASGTPSRLPMGSAGNALGSFAGAVGYFSISSLLGYTPLAPNNNLSDVASVSAARTALGLGAAALKGIVGTGTNVPTVLGSTTSGHFAGFDASGNIVDNGAGSGTGGGISGPGTTTTGNVPQWNSTNGTSVGAGIAVTQSGAASSVVETDPSGGITAASFASTSAGAGFLDMTLGASPGNPATGKCRIYPDSTAGTFLAITSSGANCLPSAIPSTTVQTNQSNAYSTGTQDFTSAAHVIAKNGTAASKPANCTVGEVYFATDATAGQNWYFCTATNTWSQQVAGGSGGAATSLVDGASNNALTVTQGTGTITNYLNVTNQPTTTSPILSAVGSDTNIDLTVAAKGSGRVYVPGTGITTGSNSPPLLQLGASGNSGGNTFGVLQVLNLPSGATSAEYLRMASNGTWQASLQGGGAYFNGGVNTGSTASGAAGNLRMANTQFQGYNLAYYGLGTSSTASDVALARNASGVFEVNSGASGGAAAASIRDIKLRHIVYSGTAPTLTTGTGTIAGADDGGRVTLSAGSQTSIVITFGTAYTTAPACVANNETTAAFTQAIASTTTLTLNQTFGSADKITWRCGTY